MKSLITSFSMSLFFSFVAVNVHAQLSGNQVITPEDYPVFGPKAVNNPPFCGMPYAELDLDRVTAVQGMGQGGCNLCLKVTSNADPSKSVFVLAIDQGGQGLDLSTGAFQVLFGQNQSPASANWQTVSSSNCAGIWSKGSANNPPAPNPPSPPNPPPPNSSPNSPNSTPSNKPKRPKNKAPKSASVSVLSSSVSKTSTVINPSSTPDSSNNNDGTPGSPSNNNNNNSNSNSTVNTQSFESSASSFSASQWRIRLFTLGVSVMILATSAALV